MDKVSGSVRSILRGCDIFKQTRLEAMAGPKELLANAERLISDATHLCEHGRTRSAATLIVVALEQMGAFVEILTRRTYPNADVQMGLFGSKSNSHARRQDVLAGHVFNFAMAQFAARCLSEGYIAEHGSMNAANFIPWLLQLKNYSLTEKQQEAQGRCPDLATAHLLLHLTRTNFLKHLREYGLYEDVERTFSEAEIAETIELGAKVRVILERSHVVPEPPKIAGINMPMGLVLDP
ncbi:AbiV family abortive infection protein [Bradyrhizobium sp. ERR14]|uniref:AbiV family abortive infection protein n=1 Tax=Bradyrhizobium sp. ERR14 TaxID=2663837 RepID=UPI00161D1422|nr:AbiV family abortive infection protein [Bradyrhizobium sp. ERR14]MBB4392575.1 AbiV family abortive infection protein [Bradyrhizobium sp. ERR14]